MPGYVSVITGLDTTELAAGARHHLVRVARDTGLFVAGFSAVFISLGLTATTVGRGLVHHQAMLTRISGLVVLSMALFVAGSLELKSPWLSREKRFHPQLARSPVPRSGSAGHRASDRSSGRCSRSPPPKAERVTARRCFRVAREETFRNPTPAAARSRP